MIIIILLYYDILYDVNLYVLILNNNMLYNQDIINHINVFYLNMNVLNHDYFILLVLI